MYDLKDSSIEWVGLAPSSWRVAYLSSVLSERKHKNIGMKENNLLSLSYGNVIRKDINTNDGLLPESFEGYNIIEAGDIVLRLTDLQNDHRSLRTGLCNERGIITSAYCTLKRNNSECDSRFLRYYLHCFDLCKGFYGMGAGVRQGLNYDGIRKIEMLLPSLKEQEAIADYLDTQLAKVDDLIANQQTQIEKLKQYKQSIITELAIKGIDPNAPMKDSGVEWIGLIPKSWSMYRLKFVCKVRDGLVDPREPQYGKLPHIGPGNIEKFTGRLTNYNLVEDEQLISGKYVFYEHDLVYGKINPQLGKVAYPRFKGLCSADAYAIISDESIVLPEFLQLWFLSRPFIDRTILESLRMGMPKINRDDLLKLEIAIPPINEQKEIIDFYTTVDKGLSRLITIKEEKAKKLDEYKKSLIYEYVTGKKEAI